MSVRVSATVRVSLVWLFCITVLVRVSVTVNVSLVWFVSIYSFGASSILRHLPCIAKFSRFRENSREINPPDGRENSQLAYSAPDRRENSTSLCSISTKSTIYKATGQLGTRPTRHMWRLDLLILHSVWRVDHTGVTSWLLVGRVVGTSQLQINLSLLASFHGDLPIMMLRNGVIYCIECGCTCVFVWWDNYGTVIEVISWLFQHQPWIVTAAPAHSLGVEKSSTSGYKGGIHVQKLEHMEERTSVWKSLRRLTVRLHLIDVSFVWAQMR